MRVCTVGFGGVGAGGVVAGVVGTGVVGVVVWPGVVWPVGVISVVVVVGDAVLGLAPPACAGLLAMAAQGHAIVASTHVRAMRFFLFTVVKPSQPRGDLRRLSFSLQP